MLGSGTRSLFEQEECGLEYKLLQPPVEIQRGLQGSGIPMSPIHHSPQPIFPSSPSGPCGASLAAGAAGSSSAAAPDAAGAGRRRRKPVEGLLRLLTKCSHVCWSYGECLGERLGLALAPVGLAFLPPPCLTP